MEPHTRSNINSLILGMSYSQQFNTYFPTMREAENKLKEAV